MNKALQIFGIMMIFLTVLTSVKAEAKFCTDSDGDSNIWTQGFATDNQGTLMDDCAGSSTNLKEAVCKDDKTHPDVVNCNDYNATCVTVVGAPDYCGCKSGFTFDKDEQTCVKDNTVPEFGVIAGAAALVGALGIFLYRRK